MENNDAVVMNEPNEPDKKSFILRTKIEDMVKYGMKTVYPFPYRERHIADRIRDSMDEMLSIVIEVQKGYYKKSSLQKLDVELDKLRCFIRIAQDRDYYCQNYPKKDKNGKNILDEHGNVILISVNPPLSKKHYEVWSNMLVEIGKLIGGYAKSLK